MVPRRPALERQAIVSIVMIAMLAIMVAAGFLLQSRASALDEAERLSLSLETNVHRLDAAVWTVLGRGIVTVPDQHAIDAALAEISKEMAELDRLGRLDPALMSLTDRYVAEVDTVWEQLVELGRLGAIAGYNASAAPIFDEYEMRVDQMTYGFDVAASRARLLAHASTIVELVIIGIAALGMRTAFRRRLTAAQRMVEEKDRFISTVSHELRTPLSGMVGFADLLRSRADSFTEDERIEFATTIAQQGHELTGIVEDLLVAARAEIGQVSVVNVAVELRSQVAMVVEALPPGRKPVVDQGGPQPWAMGDPARVRQILRNLITNAFRYGGDVVRIELVDRGSGTAVLVMDDGPPIPAEEREHIFEAYRRAGPGHGHPDAVGLGLTVCRALARMMGGDVTYRHDGGFGIFELSLPPAAADRGAHLPEMATAVARRA